MALIESIMEHIAFELKMDPLDVRMKNLLQTGDTILFSGKIFEEENRIPGIVDEMKISSDYDYVGFPTV